MHQNFTDKFASKITTFQYNYVRERLIHTTLANLSLNEKYLL